MSRLLHRSDYFWADLEKQVDWYREHATPEVAERFVDAVQATLNTLTQSPRLGRPRFIDWAELAGLRSFRVQRPFHDLLSVRLRSPYGGTVDSPCSRFAAPTSGIALPIKRS